VNNLSGPEQMHYQWVIDTTGEQLLLGLKNTTTAQWLFRYDAAVQSQRSHSAVLVPLMQTALNQTGLTLPEISRLCVCVGPGSFTGLRAGLATVKTLGQYLPTLEITPVTVFERLRLQALLADVLPANTPVTVVLDAKQQRLYTATWRPQTGWEPPQFYLLEAFLAQYTVGSSVLLVNEALCSAVAGCNAVGVLTIESIQYEADVLEALSRVSPADGFPAVPWQDITPLYLQNPNITVKQSTLKEVC
jgi:tRNA threonylcarbamoyl adenosine modification protein YeaZ